MHASFEESDGGQSSVSSFSLSHQAHYLKMRFELCGRESDLFLPSIICLLCFNTAGTLTLQISEFFQEAQRKSIT